MSKERSKRFREKLKEDPHKKAACSAKANLRVEKSRALKRKLQNPSQVLNSPFKNVQQQGKALKKVFEALPKAKEKQAEVLFVILKYFKNHSVDFEIFFKQIYLQISF